MGYRDDVDALYERSITLQRDLDQAQARLAALEAPKPKPRVAKAPPPAPHRARIAVLAATRERLARLDDETLVLVGAIVEDLAMEPARRDHLLADLRPVVDAILKVHAG